jgi:hypothetical protein
MGEEAQTFASQNRRRPVSDDEDRPNLSQPKRLRETTHDVLCVPCTLMFSHQGLESLNSTNGFRHRTRAECMISGNEGCSMCKFVFLVVCKEYDTNWANEDHLIFRNFKTVRSTNIVPSTRLPDIYGLKGSLESDTDKCIVTVYLFAKRSKYSCPFTVPR